MPLLSPPTKKKLSSAEPTWMGHNRLAEIVAVVTSVSVTNTEDVVVVQMKIDYRLAEIVAVVTSVSVTNTEDGVVVHSDA
jgi:branched-subunit amino acid transport protein